MVSPIITKQMRLIITTPTGNYTVGVVEMVDLQPLRESSVEHRYGLRGTQPDNRHKVGMKRARFTIRRWYKTDPNQGKVFYDLHDNDIEFTLREYVKDSDGFVGLTLNGCMSYNYRLVTGTANDIVGEEISGEGTVWEGYNLYISPSPCEEMIIDGGFEDDFVGWTITLGSPNISTVKHHSGAKSAEINYFSAIEQYYASGIPVSQIQSFGLWYSTFSSSYSGQMGIIIYYTDATYTNLSTTGGYFIPILDWAYFDILPYLASGKTISYIHIGNGSPTSLYLDDISLIYCLL